ncbi:hypothetical protein ACTXT7_000139 [Hymenolepis weldensis]
MSTILSGLRELCPTDIYCRIPKMLEESDKITLEDLAHELRKLDTNYVSGMAQQKFIIFHLNADSAMNYLLPDFVSSNFIFATCGIGGFKETICRTKPKFRKNIAQKVEPTAYKAKAPNQEKGKKQIRQKMGESNDVKSEDCSRDLLDGCLSKI